MRKLSAAFAAAFVIALSVVSGPALAQGSGQPASPLVTPSIQPEGTGGPAAYVWAGSWFDNNYGGGYGGFMHALNSTDSLWDNGLVVRADISGGYFTYNNIGFVNISVGMISADAMLGFRDKTDVGTFGIYVGPSLINYDNPDPAAHLRGSEVGAMVYADWSNRFGSNWDAYVQGSYTTSFSTYSAAARVLYRIDDLISLGPSFTLYGDKDPKQEYTVGPFLKFSGDFGEVGVTGGYWHPNNNNPDGYFASVYFAMPV